MLYKSMIAPKKLRLPIILAICLWAIIWVAASYMSHGRRLVVTGMELVACGLFVALFWFDRKMDYWKVVLFIFVAAFAIPHFFHGDAVFVAEGSLCLWAAYYWSRLARHEGDKS